MNRPCLRHPECTPNCGVSAGPFYLPLDGHGLRPPPSMRGPFGPGRGRVEGPRRADGADGAVEAYHPSSTHLIHAFRIPCGDQTAEAHSPKSERLDAAGSQNACPRAEER